MRNNAEIETISVTSPIFDNQKEFQNTAERDEVPEYLKSYQKAQAAAMLSHSASAAHQQKENAGQNGNFKVSGQSLSRATACPSCNSCARVRACAPASGITPVPRKKASIFKRLASRLKRFGRKTASGFNEMSAATGNPLTHTVTIAGNRRETPGTGLDANVLRQ
jgi:hypothetical protein